MKLIKLINARSVLNTLTDKDGIEPHLVYLMTKFIITSQDEQSFYTTNMQKLFDKYAQRDEQGQIVTQGNNIKIKEDCRDEFNEAVAKLYDTDVEAPNIKFPLSELSKELNLTIRQMSYLMDFIEE
jgi:hypothetical protein